jgi:hypothetical protein
MIREGIIAPAQNPALSREVARILDAPEQLFEVEDLQKDGAQREYLEFKEKGKVPVVDPSLDDHGAHYRQHGIDAQGEWFLELEEKANWDEALKVLGANWEQLLQMVAMTPGPTCLQDRIYQAWIGILTQAARPQIILDPASGQPIPAGPPLFMPPQDPEGQQALDLVLRWRAHSEDHKWTEQLKQMQAMGQPTLAAPGGQATPEGGQPAPGQPPA